MITAINQIQPQFKAKPYSHDISILTNEAKRSLNPQKAMNELAQILKILETMPEKKATLSYHSEQNTRFHVNLDGKIAGNSTINFTDALKKLCSKRGDISLIKGGSNVTPASLRKFSLDV